MWWKLLINCDLVAFEIISNFFMEHGAGGIEEQDSAGNQKVVITYLKKGTESEKLIYKLQELIGNLTDHKHFAAFLKPEEIEEKNWQEEWERYLKPIEIGETLAVKPPWEPYQNDKNKIVLEVDPGGMVFGSGHHETTRACLELMEIIVRRFQPQSFLDIGAGTGILCIGAYKLGIKKINGIDNDPLAIDCAKQNFIQNGLNPAAASVTPLDEISEKFDLIVANLGSALLTELSTAIDSRIHPDGNLLLSGILADNIDSVRQIYTDLGWKIVGERAIAEWITLHLSRKPTN